VRMTSALSVPQSRGFVVRVDVVGKAQLVARPIVERNEEISGRQQLADDLVDALKQGEQVFGRMRGFGDAVQRGTHRFGMLELGDIARHGNPDLVSF